MNATRYNADHYRSARKTARRWQQQANPFAKPEPYRETFARALTEIRYAEAEAAAEAAYQASLPAIDEEIEDEAAELRAMASTCRIDGPGNEMFRELHDRAQRLLDGARGF